MVIAWVVTRLLMLGILALFESFIVGDVYYYHRKIAGLFEVGLPGTLMEYPTPVVWILTLPYGLSLGNARGYLVVFMIFMLALDAAFTYAVWRSGGRRHDVAVDFWIAFVFLVGPLSYERFDMIPAVLAGGALLAARTRPWVAGALTGLGAAIKLWPALLIPALLADKERRKPTAIGFVVVGFGLALISLVTGGVQRLFSPLTWQSGRGLQIESIWASPLMLLRMVDPGQLGRRHLPVPGVRDLRRGGGSVADGEQRGHDRRPGRSSWCCGCARSGCAAASPRSRWPWWCWPPSRW